MGVRKLFPVRGKVFLVTWQKHPMSLKPTPNSITFLFSRRTAQVLRSERTGTCLCLLRLHIVDS
jgi:hypothetical protein